MRRVVLLGRGKRKGMGWERTRLGGLELELEAELVVVHHRQLHNGGNR